MKGRLKRDLFDLIFFLPLFFNDLQESKSMFRGVHLSLANLCKGLLNPINFTKVGDEDENENYDNEMSEIKKEGKFFKKMFF